MKRWGQWGDKMVEEEEREPEQFYYQINWGEMCERGGVWEGEMCESSKSDVASFGEDNKFTLSSSF
jgi:hypothetical protein